MSDIRAEATSFFDGISKDNNQMDLASALNWSYLLVFSPGTEGRVDSAMAFLREQCFTTVEPLPESGPHRSVHIHLSELKVHTVESFVQRVKELDEFAGWMGCALVLWSVDTWER
jgi:hypothetical protein